MKLEFSKDFPFLQFSKREQESKKIEQLVSDPETKIPPLANIETSGDSTIYSALGGIPENPDKILSKKGVEIYDEMVEKDAHLLAVYTTRRLAISRIPWDIQEADSSPRNLEMRDFVVDVINDCKGLFAEDIRQLTDAVGKGFSALEIRYKLISRGRWKGKYGIDELVFHKQKYWKFKRAGSKESSGTKFYYVGPYEITGQQIPTEKIVHYAYMADDNPYGNAAFKPLFWQFWFKKEAGWKLWVLFLEKFASPTVVGRYPDGIEKGEQDKLMDCINAIKNETGIIIPNSMALKFMEASHQGPASYSNMIDACNEEISKVILGATQTVQPGKKGSYALARTHSEVRRERVEADAIDIADVIQQQIVRRIVDYNFNTDIYPLFVMRYEQQGRKKTGKPGQPKKTGPASKVFQEFAEAAEATQKQILKAYSKRKDNDRLKLPLNGKYFKGLFHKILPQDQAHKVVAGLIGNLQLQIDSILGDHPEEAEAERRLDVLFRRFAKNELEGLIEKCKQQSN
jgi:hypothetical protein